MAKLTHDISIFTEGILMMKTTLVGIIKVDVLTFVTFTNNNINKINSESVKMYMLIAIICQMNQIKILMHLQNDVLCLSSNSTICPNTQKIHI